MNSNNALLLVCVVFGVLVLMYFAYDSYYTTPAPTAAPTVAPEGFNSAERFMGKPLKEGFEDAVVAPTPTKAVVPEVTMPAVAPEADKAVAGSPAGHMQGEVLSAQDLLPQCADSPYAQVVPNGQGSLNDGNLLNAGYHLGVDTVGSSLRNANRQLRSEPPNPQVKVSPWNQTTIEADMNKRELEIGN
jgi:hypothetical protein